MLSSCYHLKHSAILGKIKGSFSSDSCQVALPPAFEMKSHNIYNYIFSPLTKKKNFFLHKGRELELQCRFPSLGLLLLIGHNQILSSVLVQIVHQTNRANTMSSSKGKGNRYYNWVYQIEDRNSCLINHKEFSLFKLS